MLTLKKIKIFLFIHTAQEIVIDQMFIYSNLTIQINVTYIVDIADLPLAVRKQLLEELLDQDVQKGKFV